METQVINIYNQINVSLKTKVKLKSGLLSGCTIQAAPVSLPTKGRDEEYKPPDVPPPH